MGHTHRIAAVAAAAAVAGGLALNVTSSSAGRPGPFLPPWTLRGPITQLQQYPSVFLATPKQRAAAWRLRAAAWQGARRFSDPRAAAKAGFDVTRERRKPGDASVLWFHSENRKWHADRFGLAPKRPDTLIYADVPGRPLVLVGVMFSLGRGQKGPTPGGPITRWHYHIVCANGKERGIAPRPDGTCLPGSKLRAGSHMMHIWFTRDLRSSFAIHAPAPELCVAHLLPAGRCKGGGTMVDMPGM